MVNNLVFEGGGVKGIAYVGALSSLKEMGMVDNVKGYAGTSAGAITAVLCAIGLSPDQIRSILWELNFNDFRDDSFGIIRDVHRLITDFGWNKGDFFSDWIREICAEKLNVVNPSFKDIIRITGNDLRLIGSNLSTGHSEVFSVKNTPDMSIVLAARISMSIPLFFAAVRWNDCIYVDGGLFRNYPIQVFDEDYDQTDTLGFRLDSKSQIETFESRGTEFDKHKIVGFDDYIVSLTGALMSVQDDRHLRSKDWKRTVYINTGDVGAVDFDLSDDKKLMLIENGQDGVGDFIYNR